jgi:hypothetical protein
MDVREESAEINITETIMILTQQLTGNVATTSAAVM